MLYQLHCRPATLNLDGRTGACRTIKRGLYGGLVEDIAVRPSRGRRYRLVNIEDKITISTIPPVGVRNDNLVFDLGHHTEILEDTHDFAIKADRAWQLVEIVIPLEDTDVMP